MARKDGTRNGKGALELMDEAVHLLRRAPARAWTAYAAGTFPFLLGSVYLWADLSRRPFSAGACAGAGVLAAVLYVWMKCWHSVFTAILLDGLRENAAREGWSLSRVLRLACTQSALQPTSFFVLPAALLAVLPFGWAAAFYHAASGAGSGTGGVRGAASRAWRQAGAWPGQNHVVLVSLIALSGFVFIDLLVLVWVLPGLLEALLGIGSLLDLSGVSMLNTPVLAATACLTYLVMNPVFHAVHVLRGYDADSRTTGDNLKAELARTGTPGRRGTALLLLTVFMLLPSFLSAAVEGAPVPEAVPEAESPVPSKTGSVEKEDMDQAVRQVMERSEFRWRLPREKQPEAPGTGFTLPPFIQDLVVMVQGWMRSAWDLLRRGIRWLAEKLLFRKAKDVRAPVSVLGDGWVMMVQVLVLVLLAAAASLLVLFLKRTWETRNRTVPGPSGPGAPPEVDLMSADLSAGALPADEWLVRAREMADKGEWRLAVRAVFLHILSVLSREEWVTLARSKSNRDYERELLRRARDRAGLLQAFEGSVGLFERNWYGFDRAERGTYEQLCGNAEVIRNHAGPVQ